MRPNGGASADTDAIFTPIRTANAFEQTVERIGRAIKMGLLRPSERLPSERDLAPQLGPLALHRPRGAARAGRGGLPGGATRPGRRHVRGRGAAEARGARPARRAARARRDRRRHAVLRRVLEVGSAELAAERATRADVRAAGRADRRGGGVRRRPPTRPTARSTRACTWPSPPSPARWSWSRRSPRRTASISEVLNGMPRSKETITTRTPSTGACWRRSRVTTATPRAWRCASTWRASSASSPV